MKEQKVISLHGDAIPSPKVNTDLVEKLRKYLAMAEAGDINGAVIAAAASDGSRIYTMLEYPASGDSLIHKAALYLNWQLGHHIHNSPGIDNYGGSDV